MAEAPVPTIADVELVDDIELNLLDRHENHLCDALARLNLVRIRTPIPAGDEYLALVVGIDQPGQVAQHEPVFVTQPGSWPKPLTVTKANRGFHATAVIHA